MCVKYITICFPELLEQYLHYYGQNCCERPSLQTGGHESTKHAKTEVNHCETHDPVLG